MADWNNPLLTSTYTNFLAEVKARDEDLAKQFDGQTVSNLITGSIRWDSVANRWKKWNGTAWAELTTTYALTGLSTTGALTVGTTLGVTGQTTLATATATTPATGDNNTNIATTAFVKAQNYAPLASPTLTGTPAAPTAAVTTNTTQIATTAFVNAEIANDAPTKTGGGASGTWAIAISGNAATATNLSTTQGNWSTNGTISAVVGLLSWKNYGNNHVIFDASNSTSPSGGAVSNANPANAWTASYPTLMGWNGSTTYGVRVDSARVADNQSGGTVNATTGSFTPNTSGVSTGLNVINGDLTVYRSGGTTGVLYFGTSGSKYLYYDGTNYSMPGGQLDVNGSRVLNAGNYTSYSPSLTGSGASGTWNISISGNASFATSASNASTAGSATTAAVLTGTTTGSIENSALGNLTANSTTYLRGDRTWAAVANTAKAWVNFNGTGTVAFRAQSNVSSITDNGTGDYTLTFATAMADANYAVITGCITRTTGLTAQNVVTYGSGTQLAGSVRILGGYTSTSAIVDISDIFVAIFR